MRSIPIVVVLAVLALAACTDRGRDQHGQAPTVVASLFPVADFSRAIGGDRVTVRLLLPPGVEAHAFEPAPSDIVSIGHAGIFVYTGRLLEPWLQGILQSETARPGAVIDAGAGVDTGTLSDPHYWLDLDNARIMVENILAALVARDPSSAGYYRSNAEAYIKKLAELDERYRRALATCERRVIVTGGHASYGYLAKRYGLQQAAAYGSSPDAEPSPQDLARLTDILRKEGGGVVFHEELLDPRVARTIAAETGAKLLLLHGAHNISRDEQMRGATFLSLMEQNLGHLREGLRCR